MDKKNTKTPKEYDRWEKTCVKFNDAPKKKTTKAKKDK